MKYLSPREVARRLDVTDRTIQRWCRDLVVEHCRTPTGRIRFTPEQAAKLEEARQPREVHPEVDTPNPLFDHMRPVVVPMRRPPAA